MPAIFISYRKEDTQGAAAHLYKNLSETFGPQAVLMDVTRSQPGRDVRQVIDEHLAVSGVMLVIIGKAWADARDETGQRKLDSAMDGVRLETAAALKRELPVIPVLVQGATMVQPGELPPDLADLAFRNPVTLLQSQWGTDVETLVTLLRSLVQGQGSEAGQPAIGPTSAMASASAPVAAPRTRVARPEPVGRLPWLMMSAAVLGVGVLALGVYGFMVSRAPALKVSAPSAAAVPEVPAAPPPAAVAPAAPVAPTVVRAEPKVQAPKVEIAKAEVAKSGVAKSGVAKAEVAKAEPPKAAPAPVVMPTRPAAAPAPAAAAPAPAAASAAPAIAGQAKAPPALPPLTSKAAKVLSFQRWTLNSSGCGAGPVKVTGTARFSVEKTSDAIIVTEEFRGSGGGYEVAVSGQVEFGSEQPSYEIPTTGVWTGPKVFKTSGIDRVNTSDGVTPNGANVVKFQSLCG